jgi:hypothetical protein
VCSLLQLHECLAAAFGSGGLQACLHGRAALKG